jgi:hypothetical protein
LHNEKGLIELEGSRLRIVQQEKFKELYGLKAFYDYRKTDLHIHSIPDG